MFRIDSEGATVGNLFTEGDPSLGVPATVVSADWLNATQEELVTFIEYIGLTPNKLDSTQLQQAISELHLRGGLKLPIAQTLLNNSGPLDVAGFTFDSSTTKCKIAHFNIERKTDTQNVVESGTLFVTYDPVADIWLPSAVSVNGDTNVTFTSVLDAGTVSKLQYTTHDLTGTTYSGEVRFTSVTEIRG